MAHREVDVERGRETICHCPSRQAHSSPLENTKKNPARQKWAIALLISALLCGAGLRFYGLGNRMPLSDEEHYRVHMSQAWMYFKAGQFRTHSERHAQYFAPHGMLGLSLTKVIGVIAKKTIGPFISDPVVYRDNFLCRTGPALYSTLSILLLFLLARRFFEPLSASVLALLLALSPMQIIWGRSEYLDSALIVFYLLACLVLAKLLRTPLSPRQKLFYSAGCGVLLGLSLGIKWSAIFLLPFFPWILLLSSIKRIGLFSKYEALRLSCVYAVAAAVSSLSVVSAESFIWALFPNWLDPKHEYGDFHAGLLGEMLTSLNWLCDPKHLAGFAVESGPVFAVLLAPALYWLWKSRKTDKLYFLFFGSFFGFALLIELVSAGQLYSWRSTLPMVNLLLVCGIFLDRLSARQRLAIAAAAVLLTLPLSIREGLRLKKPLFPYVGQERLYTDPLPSPWRAAFPIDE